MTQNRTRSPLQDLPKGGEKITQHQTKTPHQPQSTPIYTTSTLGQHCPHSCLHSWITTSTECLTLSIAVYTPIHTKTPNHTKTWTKRGQTSPKIDTYRYRYIYPLYPLIDKTPKPLNQKPGIDQPKRSKPLKTKGTDQAPQTTTLD